MAHIRFKLGKQFNDFYAFSLIKDRNSNQRSLTCYIYETDFAAYNSRKLTEFQKSGKRITEQCLNQNFKNKLNEILNGWNFKDNDIWNYQISYVLGDPEIPTYKGNYLKIH